MKDERNKMGADGVVRVRDKNPYVVLFKDDEPAAQISICEARFLAKRLVEVCDLAESSALWLREAAEADADASDEGL